MNLNGELQHNSTYRVEVQQAHDARRSSDDASVGGGNAPRRPASLQIRK